MMNMPLWLKQVNTPDLNTGVRKDVWVRIPLAVLVTK